MNTKQLPELGLRKAQVFAQSSYPVWIHRVTCRHKSNPTIRRTQRWGLSIFLRFTVADAPDFMGDAFAQGIGLVD